MITNMTNLFFTIIFFLGKVELFVDSLEPRDYFLVHSKHLEIESSKLFKWTGSHRIAVGLKDVFESDKNEFIVLKTEETVPPGNYTIAISK
jgi:hypothetical protein